MTLIKNPDTGSHYVHVFTDEGPSPDLYTDTRSSWKRAGLPWMTMMTQRQFKSVKSSLLNDPAAVVVFWGDDESLPTREDRECFLATVYVETLGPEEMLSEYQRKQLESFEKRRDVFDAVVVQTPDMAKTATARGWKAILCPTAWDPAIVGVPDFAAKKQLGVASYGMMYGHRIEASKIARGILGSKLIDINGFYSTLRKTMLDSSVAVLTLLHCPGCSYPTMRLWQAASTSAAMISEVASPDDAWPAVSGEHYLPLPILSEENVSAFKEVLALTEDKGAMLEIAKLAYSDLKKFTPSYCMETYLVPGLEEVR